MTRARKQFDILFKMKMTCYGETGDGITWFRITKTREKSMVLKARQT